MKALYYRESAERLQTFPTGMSLTVLAGVPPISD